MPKLDKSGPEGKGRKTGRKLGTCNEVSNQTLLENLGKGMGLKRQNGGGIGKKKRLKSGKQI
ncbi:MAG: DUF5320 family protein [Marinifilum sp.]|jgi:hypothetical protein|nr:DUF5320 family protein [Marinifilum sp.]